MNYTMTEVKVVIDGILKKLQKSILSEERYLNELDSDKLLLQTISDMKMNGDELPANCSYEDFDTWVDDVTKQISSSESSLSRIASEKMEIVAFEYFLANATDE